MATLVARPGSEGATSPAVGPTQEPPDKPVAMKASDKSSTNTIFALLSMAIVVVAGYIASKYTDDPLWGKGLTASVAVTTAGGLSIFATFYVAAQALERFLEPLSTVLLPTSDLADDYASKLDAASDAVSKWAAASTDATRVETKVAAEAALKAAADAKAKVDARHTQRVILFWLIATLLAIAVSGTLDLYFLRAAGVSTTSRGFEIFATGLIIGAGTKPVHELIGKISKGDDATDKAPSAEAKT